MATNGSFITAEYEGRSLTFSWNRTSVDIVNNTSTIAWSVTGSGSYTYGYVTCGDIDVVINGTTVYNSSSDNRINVWSGTVVASGTSVISHNADGSKSFSASINAAVYNYAQNVSGSQTFALDAIPRAASIDKIANISGTSISSLDTGNAIRVYFTPKSTAFKYRVTITMNGNTYQNNASGVSVSNISQTYYQPNAIPHSWIPNSTSGTLTCKLETLNGTTVIGTSTKTITMNVPTSVVPTISSFTSVPYNTNTTISGWGIYVAGYSKARLSCSASGNSGSTISKFQISGTISATINGTSLNYDVDLKFGGSKTFTIVAIDSRGRSSESKSVNINVDSYFTPSIVSFDVIRTDVNGNASENGTSAKLSFTGSYSSIGSNASTAKFSYKLSTATTFANISTTVAGTNGNISGGIIVSNITFSTASEYDFQIQISDSLGNSISRTVRLGTVVRTMNVAKYGNGVAFGKMSTVSSQTAAGKLEVVWDADFDKGVNVDGDTVLSNLTVSGTFNHYGIGGAAKLVTGDWNTACGEESGFFRGSNLANSPTDSTWWYVQQIVHDKVYKVQIAYGYFSGNLQYQRMMNNGTWGSWQQVVFPNTMGDYVVAQGAVGAWIVRKWNSGTAECWRSITGTITNSGTWNGFRAYKGTASFPSDFFIERPIVNYSVYIGSGYAVPARGGLSTATTFTWEALGSETASNVGYICDVYAIGKWK